MSVISIIVPAFNESSGVRKAYSSIMAVFDDKMPSIEPELIFVDDGSSDDTFSEIALICKSDKRVKAVKFLNNYGAHTAIRAGLEHSTGEAAVFLACDLQDPPDIIPEMLEKLVHPYDIVLAVREGRDDQLKDRLFSRIFFKVMRKFVSGNIPGNGSSMYLMSDKVTATLRQFQEKNLTLESIFVLMNFKHTTVNYKRLARKVGSSKWTLAKKIRIFIDFFVAYSYAPIRFVSIMGIVFLLLGSLWILYIFSRQLIYGDLSPGWPTLISVLLMGFGVTNISLGIIAEYLWRTLDETRNRPKYIVETLLNFKG
jgi:glycosyltransferase involved in cell wall biosynthesis